ncbi:hypothetical protein FHS78_000628 [Parvibaculum indicum]|uniref:hypothetical protein n=1 Tax=Parvibaculum indicum TaxID=562969 RepID=UPI0014227E78|nr:hypothetical protein [Parvibaculum indicum]NIJ40358.1 hypothetical protein [Parvibaculum indicum]
MGNPGSAVQIVSPGIGENAANVDDQGNLATIPQMATGGNIAAQTNATGTDWTAFADRACKQLTLVNNTGTTIEFRQDGDGVAVPVFDQTNFTIFGIDNCDRIEIRRTDESDTQVTVAARWEG